MIADNTDSKVVSPENQEWLGNIWFPEAYQHGYRTSVVVVSKDIFNEMSVKKIVNEMDDGRFKVQFFSTLDDAKAWLVEL